LPIAHCPLPISLYRSGSRFVVNEFFIELKIFLLSLLFIV